MSENRTVATAVVWNFNMMAYSSEIIRSLVALCELIKKVFLTLKVTDSSSWTLYLRKLKCYDSGYRGPLLMSRKQARASPWKRGGKISPKSPKSETKKPKRSAKFFLLTVNK